MAWATLLKGAAKGAAKGAVQGSVKKVTAKKFLGRGGKKDRRQNVKNIMQQQGEYEGGGALAIRSTPTTTLVSTSVSDSALAVSSSGGSQGQGLGGALLRIETKTIAIDKFLKTKHKKEKEQDKKQRKVDEDVKRGKREGSLEKPKPKDEEEEKKKGLSLPMPSFFSQIKKFITNILLGWITLKLIEWGPKLMPALKMIGSALDGLLTVGGWLFDGIATVINVGYNAFTMVENLVKDIFGEKGLEIFHTFTDTFKKFLTVAIIAAMVAAKAGVLGQAANLVTWGGSALKSAGAGISKVASAVFSAPAGIVAGVGLLASAIGEGGFQLIRWSRENLENPAREAAEKAQDKKWWDPRRWFWEGVAGIMGFLNMTSQFTFNLLDIIGAPFRYLIELIRWPFLGKEGREKQSDNLAKFDARIREGFRGFFNSFDFLNIISDEEGGWGDMWGGKGAEQMKGNYGYKDSGSNEEPKEEAKLGKFITRDMTLKVHKNEMVIDATGTTALRPLLMDINNANSEEEAIEAVKNWASYEFGGSKAPVAIPVPLSDGAITAAGEKMIPLATGAMGSRESDFAETLYKG